MKRYGDGAKPIKEICRLRRLIISFRSRATLFLLFTMSAGLMLMGCPHQYVTQHPDPDKRLVFPEDHGAHPDESQWEWWYYNGDLETESGRSYHYFVAFFRATAENNSVFTIPADFLLMPWPVCEYVPFYFAGFSIVDNQKDIHRKKYRSIMPFYWTADCHKYDFYYRIGSDKAWREFDNTFRIQCNIDGYELDLSMTPLRSPLISGPEQKGNLSPYNTLHKYYSITRLDTEGTIKKGALKEKIRGTSWMDHQYGFIYHKDLQGWDWMAINLDNGIDLVCGRVNLYSGDIHPESFIGIMFPDGQVTHLEAEDFIMRPTRKWKHWFTGITYGIDWEIEIPDYDIKLTTKAKREKQQMYIPPIYIWEGPCVIQGTVHGKQVKGRGFLETFGDKKLFIRNFVRAEMAPLAYIENGGNN